MGLASAAARCSRRARSTSSATCSRSSSQSDGAQDSARFPAKGCIVNDDGPSVLTMIGAVALIVALVILVFFAAGYGFGRLFL